MTGQQEPEFLTREIVDAIHEDQIVTFGGLHGVRDENALYLGLLMGHCSAARVAVQTLCLMPNHIHLVAIPDDETGLWRRLAGPIVNTLWRSTGREAAADIGGRTGFFHVRWTGVIFGGRLRIRCGRGWRSA